MYESFLALAYRIHMQIIKFIFLLHVAIRMGTPDTVIGRTNMSYKISVAVGCMHCSFIECFGVFSSPHNCHAR